MPAPGGISPIPRGASLFIVTSIDDGWLGNKRCGVVVQEERACHAGLYAGRHATSTAINLKPGISADMSTY